MAHDAFDALTRNVGKSMSRREALRGLFTTLGGALFVLLGAGRAHADPQTCVVCTCGTGRPCNPKSTTCTEVRGFPAEQTCTQACGRKGQYLCNAGTAYHCPQGCPA
jgi:hypothetical protein